MKMDLATKKRYKAWRRRKILRFSCLVLIFVLVFAGGVILLFDLLNNGNDIEITDHPMGDRDVYQSTNLDDEVTQNNETNTMFNRRNERTPIIFCGTADHDEALTLSHEESLSYLALINRCYKMAGDFIPPDLSIVNAPNIYGNANQWIQLRYTAARALEEMFNVAYAEYGHELIIISGYRSYVDQTAIHESAILRLGLEEALSSSARQGHSEHQLGLAMDLSTFELGAHLTPLFASTLEGNWVQQNAHRFGFIISFPESREEDTGIMYEPWHIRYVGVESATIIYQNGLILEEYLWYYRD